MALFKLNPVHRRLGELEITNIRDFFNSDFISPERRKQLNAISAFWMTYLNSMKRMLGISKKARQDYYALQRAGCFAVRELPESSQASGEQLPLLIIPGLNTPSVFFREMHEYFTEKGYYVSVMDLPQNGFADVAESAKALEAEVARIQQQTGASRINIAGHCLGGLIAHYWLESASLTSKNVQNLISLGTGFTGAEGVQQLKNLWIPRNPGKPVPRVFDELIQANMNFVRRSTEVARHNMVTVWDFMVHFRKAMLNTPEGQGMTKVSNHIIEDPAIDHLTLALNHTVFARMENIIAIKKEAAQAV